MNRRLVVTAFLFAPWAISARADLAKPSTREGREELAVRMWEMSEAIVVAKCPEGVRPDGGHEIVITKVLRGPLAADGKVVLPRASVDVKDQIGRVVKVNDVVLGKDDTFVLFLREGDNGAWEMLPVSGWDGWLVGDPRDMGYLWCGGTRVVTTLEACETFQTVSALSALGEKAPEARIAGVRVLMRYSDAWSAGTFDTPNLLRELGPEVGSKALTDYLAEDVTEKQGPAWKLIPLVIEWKVPAFLEWAKGKPPGAGIADVILFALGAPENRPALIERISAPWLARRNADLTTLDIMVSFAAPEADALMRTVFERAARPSPVWADLHGSLRYLQGRKLLVEADVQALIHVVTSEASGRLRPVEITPAIEELERITGESFLERHREALGESQRWKSWWEKTGRDNAKYRPK